MTEREFLQQLFLLKCDLEAYSLLDAFADQQHAQQRARWAARLGDLLNRRASAIAPAAVDPSAPDPGTPTTRDK